MDNFDLDINKLFGSSKGPDDILQILSTGLNEKQPWALSFADSVFKDLANKIKNIKVESKPIKIDGESISKEINEGIQTNISKDINKTVENIRKGLEDTSKNISKEDKKNTIGISSFLGQTPQMGLLARVKYQGLVKNIISKIEKSLPDKFEFSDKGITRLSDIFNTNNKDKILSFGVWSKWNELQKTIITRVRKGLPDKIELGDKNVKFADIFNTNNKDKISSFGVWSKWNKLQKTIIDKVEKGLPSKIKLGDKNVRLSDIFNTDAKSNLLSFGVWSKWNKLQKTIIDKIEKGFSPGSETGLDNTIESTSKSKNFRSLEEKTPTVKIGGFTKEALISLSNLSSFKNLKVLNGSENLKKKNDGDIGALPPWLKMLGMAGVALIGGGLTSVASSLFDSGPFKGLKKLLGTLSIQLGTVFSGIFVRGASKHLGKLITGLTNNLVKVLSGVFPKAAGAIGKIGGKMSGKLLAIGAKGLGTFLKPILKKLPLIGSIISLASAFSRFKQGDIFGGVLDICSGIASLAPGIGTAISIGIDVLSSIRDMKTTKEKRAKQGASGGTAIFKILGKMAAKFMSKGLLKRIPIIGSLLNFADAWNMFKQGNIIKGLLSTAAGIAGFFPGVGTAISIGIDILNSFIKPKNEKETNIPKTKESKSIFTIAKEWMQNKMKVVWNKIPAPLKWILRHHPITSAIIKTLGLDQKEEDLTKTEGNISDLKSLAGGEKKLSKKEKYQKAKEDFEARFAGNSDATGKGPAFDFIWRKGQGIQKFYNGDNIIATKDEKLFSKLTNVLKDMKPSQNNSIFEQMHNDISMLVKRIDRAIVTMNNDHSTKKTNTSPVVREGLAGISEDAGFLRDPAYVLRARAWDRLRKGYVVL